MNKLHMTIAFSLALALIGCGGGGGSGGGGGTNPSTSASTAEFIFPWTNSAATTKTVTVRGTASDVDGVDRVMVNGVRATTATASTSGLSKASLADNNVEWSVQVSLNSGNNALAVSVEDSTGEVTTDLDTATIKYVEVPTTFSLDPDGTRVVGLGFAVSSSGYVQHLIEHNYATGEQAIFKSIWTSPELTCFRPFENKFVYLDLVAGTWELREFNLTSKKDSLLTELGSVDLDGGTGFQPGSPRELVCGGTHTSAYVLVNHFEVGGNSYTKSRILKIDLASSAISTLSETDAMATTPWLASHIALAADQIVTMRDINPLVPLTSVSLVDGARSDLTPGLNVGGFVLQPELPSDRVYVATFPGIDEIDLSMGSKRNISPVDADDPLTFSQIRSIGFDAANNRVIVGDDAIGMLIAVDVTTGERSDFLSSSVGTGAPLLVPRRIALSADASRAYVADDGGNATERLFEIDLTTGDRREVGDVSQPFNDLVTGIELDEAGRRIFVSFRRFILEVNLDTELVRTVANTSSTILGGISSILLDTANNRLLIADASNDGIYAINLTAQTIDVISKGNTRGSGPAFQSPLSLTMGTTAAEIFVADQATETVTLVDLATGDRETFSTNCGGSGSTIFQRLDQVAYNDTSSELLIRGDRIYSLDLDTGVCVAVPRRVTLLNIQSTPEKHLLAVTFGALMQVDRETGELVLVSK